MRAFRKSPQCKGYSPCKIISLGKKNHLTNAENVSTNTLKLFYAKNVSKTQIIFEKLEDFENGQKWPQCNGYIPCEILTSGQKIKLLKRCKKTFVETHLSYSMQKNGSRKQLIFKK